MRRKVIAVIQVIRHTRTKGQQNTPAGVGLSFRRGEETARFLENHMQVARAIKQRGLIYIGHPSDQGRAIQTEEQVYQGLVSNAFVREHKEGVRKHTGGGFTRQLSSLSDVRKTTEGVAQYALDPAGLVPSIKALLQGEQQPHYSEDLKDVRKRIGIVKQIERKIHRSIAENKPVVFVNLVSHSLDPYPGPVEIIAKQLTGKKVGDFGGIFKHIEGIRRVLYSDGTSETHVLRQNPRKGKMLK